MTAAVHSRDDSDSYTCTSSRTLLLATTSVAYISCADVQVRVKWMSSRSEPRLLAENRDGAGTNVAVATSPAASHRTPPSRARPSPGPTPQAPTHSKDVVCGSIARRPPSPYKTPTPSCRLRIPRRERSHLYVDCRCWCSTSSSSCLLCPSRGAARCSSTARRRHFVGVESRHCSGSEEPRAIASCLGRQRNNARSFTHG